MKKLERVGRVGKIHAAGEATLTNLNPNYEGPIPLWLDFTYGFFDDGISDGAVMPGRNGDVFQNGGDDFLVFLSHKDLWSSLKPCHIRISVENMNVLVGSDAHHFRRLLRSDLVPNVFIRKGYMSRHFQSYSSIFL